MIRDSVTTFVVLGSGMPSGLRALVRVHLQGKARYIECTEPGHNDPVNKNKQPCKEKP